MSEIDTAAIRARHQASPTAPDYCVYCDDDKWPCDTLILCDALDQARADVHLEEWGKRRRTSLRILYELELRADSAEAAVARVRALCDRNFNMEDWYEIDANDVAAALDGPGIEDLIEASSLGTPYAKRMREMTSPEDAARVVEMSKRMGAVHAFVQHHGDPYGYCNHVIKMSVSGQRDTYCGRVQMDEIHEVPGDPYWSPEAMVERLARGQE